MSLYFDKRRALASAVCVSGNAIGSFFMPPLMNYLLSKFGLRGTFLILSGLMLHIVAASLLYRPIGTHALIQERQRRKRKTEEVEEGLLKIEKKDSFLSRALNSKLSMQGNYQESELKREISFLRSTSVLSSVPDLAEYAKSWNVSSRAGGQDAIGNNRSRLQVPSSRKRTFSETGSRTKKLLDNNLNSTLSLVKKDEAFSGRNCYSGADISLKPSVYKTDLLARQILQKKSHQPYNRNLLPLTIDDKIHSKISLPIQEENEEPLLDDNDDGKQVARVETAKKEDSVDSEEQESKLVTIAKTMAKCFDVNIMKRPKMIVFHYIRYRLLA